MIAYLEGPDTTVEVPDDIGNKELADIHDNFDAYVRPAREPVTPQSKQNPSVAVPKTPIPTGIPGVSIPNEALPVPELPKWVPNFYDFYIKPSINALGPFGLPGQVEALPEGERGGAEAFTTSALKQFTSGLATPALSGIDQEEKNHPIASWGGALTGGLGGLMAFHGALEGAGLLEKAKEIGEAGVEAGISSAQRIVPTVIMRMATFGTQTFVANTIKAFQNGKVDLEQFGRDVLLNSGFGAISGGVSKLANVPTKVAVASGLGFVLSKMEGGDNREASLSSVLWGMFEGIGSFGHTEALIKEGLGHVEGAIDDYVGAKNPDLADKGVGHAIVTMEAEKYGGIDAMAKKENALQLIEDINQKIRQGKVPGPIQTVEPQKQIPGQEASSQPGGQPNEPPSPTSPAPTAPGTSLEPNQPSPSGQEKTPNATAQTQGEVFPATDVSSNPSIALHPDFLKLTGDATAIVNKYAKERNIEPTHEFARSLYSELHDVLGQIQKADATDRPAVIAQIRKEYPDIENEFATLATKMWTDENETWFPDRVAGKYGAMRPAVAVESEKALTGGIQEIAGLAGKAGSEGQIFSKINEVAQGLQPKEAKPLRYDEQGIPIRKPGSVVVTVPTAEGGVAKITHQMILNEAHDMLKSEQDRRGSVDPLAEFVRQNGGLKGFKGGIEGEEFKSVPIHMRGVVSADEMAQMAYDRNIPGMDEPSADLLRNYLSSLPEKEQAHNLGYFYDKAQQGLEEMFSKPIEYAQGQYQGEYHPGLFEPGAPQQQELNLGSPYEEDKTPAPLSETQGETPPAQPTVRGGFRALQTPHLEVEFKENGFLVFPNRKINSPADLAYGFKFLHNEAQENFFLGAIKDGEIVSVEHLAVGGIDQVAVYPYETISLIDRQAADSYFIVHNHPTGSVIPSPEDKDLTGSLRQVMQNNGIEFKGHVIIDDTKFGFIDPDGNVSQNFHHEKSETKNVPILKKYFEWLKPKRQMMNGPLVNNAADAFELFKGIQKGHLEGMVHLLNTEHRLLNSIVVPHGQFNAGTLQRLAAAYRANNIITVNSNLDDHSYIKMKDALRPTDIRVLDDIELSDNQMGFKSKLNRGVREPKAEYGVSEPNAESSDLVPSEKENIADRYDRLRQQAIDQGLSPARASKYAKDNLGNKQLATPEAKPKQQEFGAPGGVEGFGQGSKGEQSLFEKPDPFQRYKAIAASEQMKESADEIKNLVSPASAAPLAAQITREQLGKMARSYDKAEFALKQASDLFNSQSKEHNIDFIDRMERGIKQTTTALENIAKQLRVMLDEKRQEIRALGTGKLENFIENYFPHIWDQGEKQVSGAVMKAAKRPLEGSKSFLKKRTIEFTKEGIEMGLTPVSFNPVDLVLLKGREMDKYLMAHRTLNAYKENGLTQFVKLGGDRPEGWIKIDDRISTVTHMSKEGLVITGHYYAQPDAARIINNYLSPGLQKSALYQSFRYAGNLLNQFQLGFSAFHLGFTSMDAIVSKTALALNQLFEGHPVKAVQNALGALFAPVSNVLRGNELFKAWRGQGQSPMDEVMATAMESGGGRARMDQFYATKAYDQMKHLFEAGKPIQGILHMPLAIAEASSKPILEYIVPRQKLGVFVDIMKMEMENNPNMTHEEMRAIAQRAWDSVDNRMGQLVYDNLFWNRTFKDLLMASVRSVGWNLGTFRELGGGIKDLAQMPIDMAKGKKTDLSYRAAYLMALPIVAGLFGAIYQYLRTGKGPQELKDYYFPKTGGMDANGDPNRVTPPTYMKDIYHYGTDPVKTVVNKLNPLLAIIGQMLSNKDYYGTKIRNEDDPLVKQALSEAEFIGKQFEPFGFRNMRSQQQIGRRSLTDVIQPWIGVTPAPYDVNQTKAEKLAHEISASHQQIGGRTQEQAGRSRLVRDLTQRYKSGDTQAQEDLLKAYQEGKISRRQAGSVITNANLTPLQRITKGMTVDETQRVYDVSNEEEKAQIGRILERKIANHEREYVAQ